MLHLRCAIAIPGERRHCIHGACINPEGEAPTVNQTVVVLRPVGDGVKRRAHDEDLKRMVVIRSASPQLVPQAASIWETTPLKILYIAYFIERFLEILIFINLNKK